MMFAPQQRSQKAALQSNSNPQSGKQTNRPAEKGGLTMKFINFMILLLSIFVIGIPQGAIAGKSRVPGKPFVNLQEQIDDLREQIGNLELTLKQKETAEPEEPQESAGILEKYMKGNDVLPSDTSGRFIVYCDNIPDDIAISGNVYKYQEGPWPYAPSPYGDILRPVCTYYGEDDPGPALVTKTCQPGELPIGWQFILNPYNSANDHVVLDVMCIYAPDTQ
jgi:hypothetical protein